MCFQRILETWLYIINSLIYIRCQYQFLMVPNISDFRFFTQQTVPFRRPLEKEFPLLAETRQREASHLLSNCIFTILLYCSLKSRM
jgi:hypothetical protein